MSGAGGVDDGALVDAALEVQLASDANRAARAGIGQNRFRKRR
jgi:hypothetical protein